MPEALKKKLRKEGRKRGLTGKKLEAYIYGTLHKIAKQKVRKRKSPGRK